MHAFQIPSFIVSITRITKMDTVSASLCYSSSALLPPRRRYHNSLNTVRTRISAAGSRPSRDDQQDRYGGNSGRMVDENMIVLRKRIHETKMIERNYEPPANWMDWEKKYYTSYDSVICEAVGLLQAKLMDSRPSHVLAIAVLIALSVPTSFTLLLLRLL